MLFWRFIAIDSFTSAFANLLLEARYSPIDTVTSVSVAKRVLAEKASIYKCVPLQILAFWNYCNIKYMFFYAILSSILNPVFFANLLILSISNPVYLIFLYFRICNHLLLYLSCAYFYYT